MELKEKKKIKRRRYKRGKKSRNAELALKIGLLCVCVAAGITGACFYFGKEDVKLSDLTKVSLIGYDSEGKISAQIDAAALEEDVPQVEELLDTVEMEFSMQEHLSNGDTVKISYIYDKELAKELDITVSDNPSVLTVENLPEAETISLEELFADVELVMEGVAPALAIRVENHSEHPYIQTMDFVIRDEKEYYKKGDTVIVDAVFSQEDAIAYRYAVEEGENGYSHAYGLDQVDSYLTGAGQLTEEDKNALIAKGTRCFTDANEYGLRIFSEAGCMPIWVDKKTTFTWQNPYVISMYFNTAKEDAIGETGVMVNDVKIVYGVTLMQADGVHCDAEIVVRFDGLILKKDGTIDLSLDSGKMISASHKDKFIKDIVNNTYADEKYDSERIL